MLLFLQLFLKKYLSGFCLNLFTCVKILVAIQLDKKRTIFTLAHVMLDVKVAN